MDNTNNTYTPPSEDQIIVAAMSQGCTELGAQKVAKMVRDDPKLDLREVIKKVAASK